MIRFGPAGLGGVKEAILNLGSFKKMGISACEIAFTYGVYLKEQDVFEIGKVANKLDIKLSIHAPYWLNLNSKERKKVEESKKRILDCCRIGNALGAGIVVFHPGYYGKMDKEKTFENIKKQVKEIVSEIKKHKWKINIAAETTGKANVFGSVEEIAKLVKETGCSFCIDFAHIRARERGKIDYKEILGRFKEYEKIHIHFSGIEYGDKGERRHILTPESEIKELLKKLQEIVPNKDITIINESPMPVEDSLKAIRIWKSLRD